MTVLTPSAAAKAADVVMILTPDTGQARLYRDDIEADALPSVDEPNKLLIHIRYKVRDTGTAHNMVYPFYLRRSEES